MWLKRILIGSKERIKTICRMISQWGMVMETLVENDDIFLMADRQLQLKSTVPVVIRRFTEELSQNFFLPVITHDSMYGALCTISVLNFSF